MIQIHSSDGKKIGEMEKAYVIEYHDGDFYKIPLSYDIKNLCVSKYDKTHDIIADLFFKQLNNRNYSYTSSSSINGYFNLDESGVLVFCDGTIVYAYDKKERGKDETDEDYEESQILCIEDWS